MTVDQQQLAREQKRLLDQRFFRKGLVIAILSGISYGLFTAFLNLGMSLGIWAEWAGGVLSVFVVTYIVSALGSALMYTFSALWSMALSALQGKLGDFFRSLWTKPGRTILVAALLGGPIAGTAYVIALQQAGSIVIPITGLNPAIGALLGRILYKQALTPRMVLGIVICFLASMMIAGQSLFGSASDGMVIGVLMAFIAGDWKAVSPDMPPLWSIIRLVSRFASSSAVSPTLLSSCRCFLLSPVKASVSAGTS